MYWLFFALYAAFGESTSITPTYISGFISDMTQYKSKRVISNYVNVSLEDTEKSGSVEYFTTEESAIFRTFVAENWSGYTNTYKTGNNTLI